jgi:catechol 2,3-dioxygenase-like lactoylglutathione lyase family enzyme
MSTKNDNKAGAVQLQGIHHIKFCVSDFESSLTFYEAVLGARRMEELDHRLRDGTLFGVILEAPGLGTLLELRLNPPRAKLQSGFDPVTWAVPDCAALEQLMDHLDEVGIKHSPILTGLEGWVVVVDDPDGRRLRFYTIATHGPELEISISSPWLADILPTV